MKNEENESGVDFLLKIFGFIIIIIVFIFITIKPFSDLKNNNSGEMIINQKEKKQIDVVVNDKEEFKEVKIENKGNLNLSISSVNSKEYKTNLTSNEIGYYDCNETFVFHSKSTCKGTNK